MLSYQRVVILSSWFLLLVMVRTLLSLSLSNVWFGTIGSVTVTFAIFYALVKYTPLRKYKSMVNEALVSWYKKKHLVVVLIISASVVAVLVLLIEYGHANYSKDLIPLIINDQSRSMQSYNSELGRSVGALYSDRHSAFDVLAIMLASLDQALNGLYLKSSSYVLAEHLEVLGFIAVVRKERADIFA